MSQTLFIKKKIHYKYFQTTNTRKKFIQNQIKWKLIRFLSLTISLDIMVRLVKICNGREIQVKRAYFLLQVEHLLKWTSHKISKGFSLAIQNLLCVFLSVKMVFWLLQDRKDQIQWFEYGIMIQENVSVS